ncbi:MAG: DUF4136 domain-containing protein [Bacteroidia bacterium]|nr:DUF4136 domain-containing protein [Bacteroidia bacterium]
MKTLKLLSYSIVLILFGCAASSDLISEFDETVDFDKYSTFVVCIDDLFVENTQYPNYDNNTVREILSNEVEEQMIKKGHKTNVVQPELQAGFQLIIEKKEATFTNCEEHDDLGYWEECTIDTEIYTEETLVLYVSDFSMNQVIWQSSITCDMNRSKGKLPGYIKELVAKLFNEYPRG